MVRRGVARFAFAGEAEALDRVARAARAARAAALRVTLHVAVKAIRAAHVCYAVVPGVLRENAQYLRAGRAQCANTLWRLQSLPLPPTSLLWPRQILVHYLDVHVNVGGAHGDPRCLFEL